jgi:dolichyl-phosphate-mannose-protein mannosyltransferase
MNRDDSAPLPPPRDRLLLLLLAAGLILRLSIAWAPFSYLASRGPLLDDAFYSLSIARNLAAGHGPTADGIHPTSGFQPLYTFSLVPFYLLSPRDSVLPIHLALTLLALCGAATGWLIYRIVSRVASRPAALFSLALWTFAPYFLFQGENGLETGLFGLCLAATLDFYLLRVRSQPTPRRLVLLGVLLGVTFLARVDGALFAAALFLDMVWLRRPSLRRVGEVILPAAAALAPLAPYLMFLWLRFGTLLPESGSAVRFLSLCYGTLFVLGPRAAYYFPPDQVPSIYYAGSLRKAVQVLLGEPLLFPASLLSYLASAARLFSPRVPLLVFAGGALLLASLLLLKRRRGSPEDSWRGLVRIGALCAFLWIPAYAFGVLGQWWFNRYFFPLFLLMAVASGPLLDRLAAAVPPFRRIGPGWVAAGAALLHLACFLSQAPEEFFRNKPYQNVSEYIRAAEALDAALPPGSKGGAFQSGTVGYFARSRVINLDGVVNRDAARALREGRMADYVREEGIEAIIDWPLWFEALLVHRSPEGAGRNLGPVEPAGRFLLLRVESSRNRVASRTPQGSRIGPK